MKTYIKSFSLFLLISLVLACDNNDPGVTDQSDRCNNGDKATLSLDIIGVGNFVYVESGSAISHATDTEGSGVDAVSMYIYWKDPNSADSLAYDITLENLTLSTGTYAYDSANFNGTVNFYHYNGGVLQAHYTFVDWETSIFDFEAYATSSAGGYTTTRLAFVDAMTSGTLRNTSTSTTHLFTSTYTICPEY